MEIEYLECEMCLLFYACSLCYFSLREDSAILIRSKQRAGFNVL
uniref:Uncharacterized protein n=1 Tax=Anguilla anguilla TaxID=7936 RepID=A0A0E9W3V9_ANGAN